VAIHIAAPRSAVWAELEKIERHVDWMMDAVAIRFLNDRHRGVGTEFECDTKMGPFRLTDVMDIIEWEPELSMSVRHRGAVSGLGRFTLRDETGGATTLLWEERLAFPWWLGSTLGAAIARPILARVWRGNLRRFEASVLAGGAFA